MRQISSHEALNIKFKEEDHLLSFITLPLLLHRYDKHVSIWSMSLSKQTQAQCITEAAINFYLWLKSFKQWMFLLIFSTTFQGNLDLDFQWGKLWQLTIVLSQLLKGIVQWIQHCNIATQVLDNRAVSQHDQHCSYPDFFLNLSKIPAFSNSPF